MRDPPRDMALLQEVHSMLLACPSAVVEALAANILSAEEYTKIGKAAASPEALERNDRWRRHQVAHFFARNAPPLVRQALGVEFPTIGGSA